MNELTGKARDDFNAQKPFYFHLLPHPIQLLIIFKWFNENGIPIDIQHWQDDGFDYAVTHPFLDQVFTSKNHAGNRAKDFDLNLSNAIEVANRIYNE